MVLEITNCLFTLMLHHLSRRRKAREKLILCYLGSFENFQFYNPALLSAGVKLNWSLAVSQKRLQRSLGESLFVFEIVSLVVVSRRRQLELFKVSQVSPNSLVKPVFPPLRFDQKNYQIIKVSSF